MWFATQAGLDRYDGRDIRVFENTPFDSNSLVHNQIQTIYSDRDGSIWIGTYGGLSHLTPDNGTFTTYTNDPSNPRSLSNNVVVAIERDVLGKLWVGTLDGLNVLNQETGDFTVYRNNPDDPGSLPADIIRDIHCDELGRLWIGTSNGLSQYKELTHSFMNYHADGNGPALGACYVMTIISDPRWPGVLWIGTWGGGLCRYDTMTGTSEFTSLPDDRIYTGMIDSRGRIWIGTWGGGLVLYFPDNGKLENYRTGSENTIPHDVVYSLFEDSSGIIWIGTNGGGVAKLIDWHNMYRYYQYRENDPDSLPLGKISAMLEDASGRIWYGVYNQGLHRLEDDTGKFRHYFFDKNDTTGISNDIINRIYQDPSGRIWVCTNMGLDLYREETDTFSHPFQEMENNPIRDTVYYEYLEDSAGRIWIGTYTDGLYLFDPEEEVFTRFATDEREPRKLSDDLIRTIFEDSDGIIWIGTNNGLNMYDSVTGTIKRFTTGRNPAESLSSGNIREIAESSGGLILLATMGGGVDIYNKDLKAFSHLTTMNGLSSNMVRSVLLQDDLWYFPTQIGLSVYNSKTKKFSVIDENTGLLSNETTDGNMIASKGALHIGSAAGVTIIDRYREMPAGQPPPIAFTGITILGKPFEGGDIILPYRYNTISVEYAVLDYADPENNLYDVMLEGLDSDWQGPSYRNYISYSSLPSGTYTLCVKGAGSRQNWNQEGVRLPITVLQPWWWSQWASATYIIIFIFGNILIFLIIRSNNIKTVKKLASQEAYARDLEKKVEERTAEIEKARKLAEEATEAKSRFLATMSHEIRTPLNGIAGMCTLLEKTAMDPEQQKFVSYTRIAADGLFTLVNDVLDLERIMSGHMIIDQAPFSLREAVNFISGIYGPMAADHGLSFTTDISQEVPEVVQGDRMRIIQIMTNLITNAIKFTETGVISLSITSTSGDNSSVIVIEVSDTGPGIPTERQREIFEEFTQLDTNHTVKNRGAGLGLAIVQRLCFLMNGEITVTSTMGKGSVFTARIPMKIPEDIVMNQIYLPNGEGSPHDSAAGKSSRLTILLAEDEAINRLFMQRILENRGHRVFIAGNGKEAVQLFMENSFDIIFMDLGMPVLGGLEATKEIRRYEQETGMPRTLIFALTAHAYQSDIDSCFAAGMDDFLSKPINERVLFQKISDFMKDVND